MAASPTRVAAESLDIFASPLPGDAQKCICQDMVIGKLLGVFFLKGRTCFSLLLSKMVRIHKAGMGIVCGRNKCERKKQGREKRKNPARKKDKGECLGGGVGRGPLICQPLPPTSSMSGNLVWISLETPIPYAPLLQISASNRDLGVH